MNRDVILEGNILGPSVPEGPGRLTVREGRVVAVDPFAGDDPADVAIFQSPGATDAGPPRLPADHFVVPGFVDAHTHLIGLGLEYLRPNCGGSASRASALARVADWLRAHPGSGPVIGEGWDQSDWADPMPPTRADLDAICPDRPLALRRVCGHVAVFNSRALKSLGTAYEGLDPESGLALEHLPLTIGRLWPPEGAVMDEAVRLGQAEAWRRGVTAIHEMGHPGTFRAFGRAQVAGRLRLRVTHFFPVERLEAVEAAGLVPGLGGEWLRVGGMKFFLDGSIGGRTAAVRVPYPATAGAESGGEGMLLWEDLPLRRALEGAAGLGFPPAMHAIGDRAIAQAISVVERMHSDGRSVPAPGPRLEHAEMLDGELLARGAAAGFTFSMQPNFTARWQHPGGLYEQVLSSPRAAALNPYRAVALTERLIFGSDTMPLDPLFGLAGAIRHPVPTERLCFRSALRRYTQAAAAAVPFPFGNGTLEPGAPADFVVLRLPPDVSFPFAPGVAGSPPVERMEVAATWVAGECVYADAAFREAVPAAVPSEEAG
jgi:predicted amidohydrolase YtcJ